MSDVMDEAGVCEVALDLVELKDLDRARRLLDEQAPNRHSRKCPTCGADPGVPCADLDEEATAPITTVLAGTRAVDGGSQGPVASTLVKRSSKKRSELLIPHAARMGAR